MKVDLREEFKRKLLETIEKNKKKEKSKSGGRKKKGTESSQTNKSE